MATLNGEGTIQIVTSLNSNGNVAWSPSVVLSMALSLGGNISSAPSVFSALAISHIKIRVIFDQQMKNDNRLLDVNNYSVVPVTLGVSVVVLSVSPGTGTNPTYVDLTTTEMTGDWDYQINVVAGASGPMSYFGVQIGMNNFATFEGVGERPTIKRIESTSINGANIIFSEPMLDNDYIRNPEKYVFDGGLTVSSISDVDVDTVKLVTSDQTPGTIYNLTIG